MILNTFAIVDLFVAGLRLLAALVVLYLSTIALRTPVLSNTDVARADVERRESISYLLLLLSFLLLSLNVGSWPLLYLLLQSYVPQWPGVMCIYGVTRIGAGSMGASRWLPDLLALLQSLKPTVVFCSGVWLVLYAVNRVSKTASLMTRVIVTQLVLGLLSLLDAAAEITYLLIPKQEQFLSTGCCTAALDGRPSPARMGLLPAAIESFRGSLLPAYLLLSALLILLIWIASRPAADWSGWGLAALLGLSVLSAVVGGLLLVEVVAPAVLHLPYHRCPYDLFPKAPDIVVGAALGVAGLFCTGWACAARLIATRDDVRPVALRLQHRLLAGAAKCYVGSLLVISLGLALA